MRSFTTPVQSELNEWFKSEGFQLEGTLAEYTGEIWARYTKGKTAYLVYMEVHGRFRFAELKAPILHSKEDVQNHVKGRKF